MDEEPADTKHPFFVLGRANTTTHVCVDHCNRLVNSRIEMLDDLNVFAKVKEEKQLIEYPWMIRADQANNNNNSIIIIISLVDEHRKQDEKNTETDIVRLCSVGLSTQVQRIHWHVLLFFRHSSRSVYKQSIGITLPHIGTPSLTIHCPSFKHIFFANRSAIMSSIVNYLIYVLVLLCTSGFLQDGQ